MPGLTYEVKTNFSRLLEQARAAQEVILAKGRKALRSSGAAGDRGRRATVWPAAC